jgi:hypothetical protein
MKGQGGQKETSHQLDMIIKWEKQSAARNTVK